MRYFVRYQSFLKLHLRAAAALVLFLSLQTNSVANNSTTRTVARHELAEYSTSPIVTSSPPTTTHSNLTTSTTVATTSSSHTSTTMPTTTTQHSTITAAKTTSSTFMTSTTEGYPIVSTSDSDTTVSTTEITSSPTTALSFSPDEEYSPHPSTSSIFMETTNLVSDASVRITEVSTKSVTSSPNETTTTSSTILPTTTSTVHSTKYQETTMSTTLNQTQETTLSSVRNESPETTLSTSSHAMQTTAGVDKESPPDESNVGLIVMFAIVIVCAITAFGCIGFRYYQKRKRAQDLERYAMFDDSLYNNPMYEQDNPNFDGSYFNRVLNFSNDTNYSPVQVNA